MTHKLKIEAKTGKIGFLLLLSASIYLISCRHEFTEEIMKKDIKKWWGTEIITDVIIDDYLQEDTVITVLSKLVIAGDTTARMSFEFKKFKRDWKIAKGPVTEDIRKLCVQEFVKSPITLARETVLKVNMRNFQSVVEIYAAEKGSFPAYIVSEDSELVKEIVERLSSNVKNPYLPEQLAFIDALGDTSEWFPEYIGKVVYFPWVIEDGTASKYLIRGSKSTGFIDLILGL